MRFHFLMLLIVILVSLGMHSMASARVPFPVAPQAGPEPIPFGTARADGTAVLPPT